MRKNLMFRAILVLWLLFPLVFYHRFYHHFSLYLSGSNIALIVRSEWKLVIINIVFFLSFLIPLSYRRKVNWTEYGLVFAFFISLFVEMYGIPFTLLFISNYLNSNIPMAPHVIRFSVFGVPMGANIGMVYGFSIMTVGMIIIVVGWITLYRGIKKEGLVTTGIYAHSRHPQYLGFILIILGWVIGWPTIMTVVFSVILIYKYITVCLAEEKEVAGEHPEYEVYKKKVPFMI